MLRFSEIKNIIKDNRRFLESDFNVSKIGIFGSFANNQNTENSDIDILVDFRETPSLIRFFELEEYLEAITRTKVDLVSLNSLNKRIKDSVINQVQYL